MISSKTKPTRNHQKRAEVFNPLHLHRILATHYGPSGWWPGESPFEVMLGALLTQNTAWTNVEKAITNLKAHGALTPASLYALPDNRLAELIRPSGYFNIKTRRLKNLLATIMNHAGGDLPAFLGQEAGQLRAQLLAVNGIGKETADSICCYAAEKPVFVVDAYTKRLLLRHGYINDTWDYDRIQELFASRLPAETQLLKDLHAYIVFVGKDFCRPRNPDCGACPVAQISPPVTDKAHPMDRSFQASKRSVKTQGGA